MFASMNRLLEAELACGKTEEERGKLAASPQAENITHAGAPSQSNV
jgi:hypothetical protein